MINSTIRDIPLNTTDIPQSSLNIDKKDRSNLFPWRGQFSPQFIEALLAKYAATTFRILDPFAGSGTVLYEAGLRGMEAVAAEINPSAYRMAQTYQFINESYQNRFTAISSLEDKLQSIFFGRFMVAEPELDDSQLQRCFSEVRCETDNPLSLILLDTLVICLDLYNGLTPGRLRKIWNRLKTVVLKLPFSARSISVYNCDARALPLRKGSIDLVLTSPPYINVFNYHQQYRASAELLGWDLLQVAKSEIGSNRKHRGNRFLTVIQYCLDLTQSLQTIASVCKPNSRIIFVVGRESRVRGVPFYNGEIVCQLATAVLGLGLPLRQERVFKNKFGKLIYEDILHFENCSVTPQNALANARTIASQVLEASLPLAAEEVRCDLEEALANVSEVQASPLFCPHAAISSSDSKYERAAGSK